MGGNYWFYLLIPISVEGTCVAPSGRGSCFTAAPYVWRRERRRTVCPQGQTGGMFPSNVLMTHAAVSVPFSDWLLLAGGIERKHLELWMRVNIWPSFWFFYGPRGRSKRCREDGGFCGSLLLLFIFSSSAAKSGGNLSNWKLGFLFMITHW